MKIFRKINKGLILTLIVLLILVIYVASVEKQRNADKPDIKKACEEFIKLTDKYSVLPNDMQTLDEKTETNINEYTEQMQKDLKEIMISNDEALKIQQQVLEKNLKNGYNKLEARTKQERKIQKVEKYVFDGNQVTVNLRNQVEIEIKVINGIEEHTENKTVYAYDDEIILQKVEGKWKVVYSNLQYDNATQYIDSDTISVY